MSTYSIETYTLSITSGGVARVVAREGGAVQESIDLNEVYCNISKSGSNFTTTEEEIPSGGIKISNTGVSSNTVTINTSGDICNIGLSSCEDMDNGLIQIRLKDTDLEFYQGT